MNEVTEDIRSEIISQINKRNDNHNEGLSQLLWHPQRQPKAAPSPMQSWPYLALVQPPLFHSIGTSFSSLMPLGKGQW